jgi:hypothetical protein
MFSLDLLSGLSFSHPQALLDLALIPLLTHFDSVLLPCLAYTCICITLLTLACQMDLGMIPVLRFINRNRYTL